MINIRQQNGSSTLEFMFCAPLLMMIMFIAMELNERIEQRVTSTIAAGNAGWLVDPDAQNATMDEAQNLAKADILGRGSVTTAGSTVTLANDAVLSDSSTVMTYSPSKSRADQYVAKINRASGNDADSHAATRSKLKIGTSHFDDVSSSLGNVAQSLQGAAATLTDPPALPTLFPKKSIEEQTLAWSMSHEGGNNLAIKAIEELAIYMDQNDIHSLDHTRENQYRLLAHRSHFLRRDPAYHPDAYKNEAIYGIALGTGEYNSYAEDCFMKFSKKPCGQENGFYKYVQRVHYLIVTGKTIIDSSVLSCIAASLGFGAAACAIPKVAQVAVEDLITETIDNAIGSVIKKAITTGMTTITNKFTQAISSTIKEQLKSLRDQVKNKVDSTIADSMSTPATTN